MFCRGMELRLPLKLFKDDTSFRAVCGTCGFFRMMHEGVSAPLCCAFIHRVAFEEVSRHQVLMKSVPGNHSLLACGTTRELRLEFPCETGLILMCAGKIGNPFHKKQENRHSCCNWEGRRGSNDVVRGTWVLPSSEACILGSFGGAIMGAKYRFALQ